MDYQDRELIRNIVRVRDEDRKTSDLLSVYEYTKIVAVRAQQIAETGEYFAKIDSSDPKEIAIAELKQRVCPMLIRREIGNHYYEYVSPNDLIHPNI